MESPLTGGMYEIVIAAHLDEDWSAWFDDFAIEVTGRTTTLRGKVIDQAALHGVLARVRDLAVPLLEVHHMPASDGPGRASDPTAAAPPVTNETPPGREST